MICNNLSFTLSFFFLFSSFLYFYFSLLIRNGYHIERDLETDTFPANLIHVKPSETAQESICDIPRYV